MPHQPDRASIGAIGGALAHIRSEQDPESTVGVVTGLATLQQQLEAVLDPSSANAQGILSSIGDAAAKLTKAAEVQAALGVSLTDYLGRIGFGGFCQEVAVTQDETVEPHPRPAFTERSDSKDPYYAVGKDGTMRPRDPITGGIMWPGEIPPSLLADPELREGYEFWKEHGKDVPFRLLLVSHDSGEGLTNSEVNLYAEAQRLQQNDGVLFLECVTSTAARNRELLEQHNAASNATGDEVEREQAKLRQRLADNPWASFRVESLSQIMSTRVDVAIPDYCEGDARPADVALTALGNEIDAAANAMNSTKAFFRCTALELAYTYYRDMYLVCKMGAELAKCHAATGLPGGAAFLGGRTHENIGVTLRQMGVKVTDVGKNDSNDPWNRHLVDCVGRGVITDKDAKLLLRDMLSGR
ncbi:MAG TPA: hypothetical protein VMR45_00475 [Patescibacteria group bacterium]|nr:hypothetical protein [Patescibacteria group bacterium]